MSRVAYAPCAEGRAERQVRVDVVGSIGSIEAEDWDALAGADDPFTEYAFLAALEESESVGPADSGWQPLHLLAREAEVVVGAMPLYLKTDSYGEYIFDWAWAEAAHRAGVSYYPKLVSAVPFTPAGAGRLLVAHGHPAPHDVRRALVMAALKLADAVSASSLHLLFCSEEDCNVAGECGLLPRLTYQFHWQNAEYLDYEEYLGCFRSSARKAARRERRQARQSGLSLSMMTGDGLDQPAWDALYHFYCDTTNRKWGQAYLNRAFFELLPQRLAHRVRVALATNDQRQPMAGALFFEKGRHLYGRYWGSHGDDRGLHFELCYNLPIEYCIEQGHRRFEAGAQGLHKLKRGLLPQATHSAHFVRHPGLRRAVRHHLEYERQAIEQEMAMLARHGPFRRGD